MRKHITKIQAQKWVDALRSGKFKQTTGALQDSQGHCCLGVACEIFIPKSKQSRKYNNHLVGGMPEKSAQPFVPEWLAKINGNFSDLTGQDLASLNDSGWTFDDIANIIELVYVHEAL